MQGYKKEYKLSDKTWLCPNCNQLVDRDLNASKNIEFEGLRQTDMLDSTVRNTGIQACGEIGIEDYSLKQEYVRQSYALPNT